MGLPTNAKKLVNIFSLNLNRLVEHKEKHRWINVLRQLCEFEEREILEEYENILERTHGEMPRLYYLEGVRRELQIKRNQNYKSMPMPKQIKDLFK